MLLGNKIREFRDEQKLLQRQLAAALEIDTPMFSKLSVETDELSESKWLNLQNCCIRMKMRC